MKVQCPVCQTEYDLEPGKYKCECGAKFVVEGPDATAEAFEPSDDDPNKTIAPKHHSDFDPTDDKTMPGKRDRKPDGYFEPGELILNRYKVLGSLGRGGMGVVYKCFDETAGIEIALKALPPELSHDEEEMEDIKANFQIVSRLVHQNICISKNLEKDSSNGNYYLIMECVEGEDLRRWIRREKKDGKLTLENILPLIRQVADALDYAHEQKIIHRDIKPGNIMVDSAGHVKVLDFGLAAQIHTSMTRVSMAYQGTSGTGPYMAPEQWEGRAQGAAADQYALAVMTYEMLAGNLPFESTDAAVLREAVLKSRAVPVAGLPKFAQRALDRAMSKDPAERFASCADFVAALEGRKIDGTTLRVGKTAKIILASLLLLNVSGISIYSCYRYISPSVRPHPAVPTPPPRPEPDLRLKQIKRALSTAEEAFKSGNWEKAVQCAEAVLNLDPSNARAKEIIARARRKMKEESQPKPVSTPPPSPKPVLTPPPSPKPVSTPPPSPKLDPRLEQIKLALNTAEEAFKSGNWEKAVQCAEAVLNLDPSNARAKEIIARTRSRMKEEPQQPKPVSTPPPSPKPDPRLEQIKRALNTAEEAFKSSKWEKAVQCAGAVLNLDPSNARAKEIIDQSKEELKLRYSPPAKPQIEQDKARGIKFSSDGKTLLKIPRNITRYDIPEGITCIKDKAFSGCSSLSEVSIPDGVKRIGDEAFYKCTQLRKIVIPDSVQFIGKQAFAGCSGLVEIRLSRNLTIIEEKAFFKCHALKTVTIPDGAAAIKKMAFAHCSSLENVIIGSGVKHIGQEAFIKCSGLKKIEIPGNVETWGKEAFLECVNLEEAILCDGVKTIGQEAFKRCRSLRTVRIPADLKTIGKEAFYGTPCDDKVAADYPQLYKAKLKLFSPLKFSE